MELVRVVSPPESVLDFRESTEKETVVTSVGIVFEDLTYKLAAKGKKARTLIDGASGSIRRGRLTAVMGASGAGKTTFLNLLVGRIINNGGKRIITGSIRVEGKDASCNVQQVSGYVQQEDVLLPHLTPREHLEFAAKMLMPRTTTTEEINTQVEKVLRQLRLSACADTRIGDPLVKPGISGGERKRTAVGIELVAEPPLLFLDEPTSGLDSDTAASLVHLLHNLVSDGHTILCTIHQPSSSMFAEFDDLILLASGRIVYSGPARDAIAYFAALGHQCAPQVNPAEFLVALLQGVQRSEDSEVGVLTIASLVAARAATGLPLRQAAAKNEIPLDRSHAGWNERIGIIRQLGLLLSRSWKMVIRDSQATVMKFVQYVFVTVFASLLFFRLGDTANDIQSKAGNVFSTGLLFSFMPAQGIILLFPAERPVFLREYARGLYHPLVYFLANNLAQLPFQIAFPLICAAINYWLVGLRASFAHFMMFALVSIITFMIGASIGLLVGAALADVGHGMELGPTLIIPQMLVAGLFVTSNSMPAWIRWLQYLSFGHWAWNANMQNEFLDRPVLCSSLAPNCTGNDLLKFYSLYDTGYGLAVGVLISMLACYRSIAYCMLHLSAYKAYGSN